ncbi:MAG: ATP synthase F0 subunit B [Deltaproteobacteria bacterium]|nr:ATP synthase F0 subunit B [Deltaproteobacteria bacterium]MBW1941244.1 ATP synthase F0 subunit B [Deltaproteobacteria bacterium]MBW2205465.1 ATP synthase F0 subunit B [Deltaproteobacteria bacterium]
MLKNTGRFGKNAVLIAFFACLLVVIGGWASGQDLSYAASGAGEGVDRSEDLKDLLYRFINFTLMVIILVWALKKANIKDFLAARTREIKQRLEDLQREKEEAEEKFRDIEGKLKDFEEEKKRILEQYRQEGETEKEKIIAEAGNRVQEILSQAELTIQQETESAKARLKQEMVEIAAQKAEEIIADRITENDQDSLVDDFIERVGKIH